MIPLVVLAVEEEYHLSSKIAVLVYVWPCVWLISCIGIDGGIQQMLPGQHPKGVWIKQTTAIWVSHDNTASVLPLQPRLVFFEPL